MCWWILVWCKAGFLTAQRLLGSTYISGLRLPCKGFVGSSWHLPMVFSWQWGMTWQVSVFLNFRHSLNEISHHLFGCVSWWLFLLPSYHIDEKNTIGKCSHFEANWHLRLTKIFSNSELFHGSINKTPIWGGRLAFLVKPQGAYPSLHLFIHFLFYP